jgi:NADPH2:quinone reductase
LNLSVIYANEPRLIREAWPRLIAAYLAGTLRPRIARRFALSEAADAHRLMESRAATGKILLDPHA